MGRRTTAKQDAQHILGRLAEATRPRTVGDAVLSYNGREATTIVALDGPQATLANGDQCHVSHLRSLPGTAPAPTRCTVCTQSFPSQQCVLPAGHAGRHTTLLDKAVR
jgi:hypothetical protein